MQPKFYGLFKQLFKFNVNAKQQQGLVTSELKECKKSQRGFNAIELSLVLAVISVAIVATIRVMGNNSDKQKSTQMVSDVTAFVSNIRNAYSSSDLGYQMIDTQAIIDMKAYPSDLTIDKTDQNKIKTQFPNGDVEINYNKDMKTSAFDISYSSVPAGVCASVINTLGSTMFLEIQVAGAAVYKQSDGKPLDGSAVAAGCKNAGTTGTTITFTAS